MTGLSSAELSERGNRTGKVMLPALLFVAGFSLVFVGLGASASVLGQFMAEYRFALEKIGGVLVIAFGVLMLGIIKIPGLYGEARLDMSVAKRFGGAAAFVMGIAFAAGWTPCVGPILAAILGLAGQSGDVARGALLLLTYSLGLGLPFLAVALLFDRATPLLRWLNRHALTINRVAGVFLVIVGLLIVTGRLAVLATWLTKVLPTVAL